MASFLDYFTGGQTAGADDFRTRLESPLAQMGIQMMANGGWRPQQTSLMEGVPQALQRGFQMQDQRRERQERDIAKNRTLEWAKINAPEIAPLIESGEVSGLDALRLHRENKQRQEEQQRRMQIGENLTQAIPGLDRNLAVEDPNLAFSVYQATKPKPMDLPSSVREFEYARQQGFDGGYMDFVNQQGSAKAPKTTIQMTDDKFAEASGKHMGEMFGGLAQDGMKARTDAAMVDQLSGLLGQFDSGGGARIKQIAGDFGVNTEGLDEIQAAQALINRMIPEQRQPGSGTMSDADLALFKESLPRIINQPGGNALIIETLRRMAEYRQSQGQIAQQALVGRIDRETAMQQLNALPNPMEGLTQALSGRGKDINQYLANKYGLEKK